MNPIAIRQVEADVWLAFLAGQPRHSEADTPCVVDSYAAALGYEVVRVIAYEGDVPVVGKQCFVKNGSVQNPVLIERHAIHFANPDDKRGSLPAFGALLEWCESRFIHFNAVGPLPPWAEHHLSRKSYHLEKRQYWTLALDQPLRYHTKTAYGVTRFQREPMAELCVSTNLEAFMKLHRQTAQERGFDKPEWMERKESLMRTWMASGCGLIFEARVAGMPVGGLFVLHNPLHPAPISILLFTGMNETGRRANAGAALHDFAANHMLNAGAHHWALGQTGDNANLATFRERLGAAPVVIYSAQKTYRPLAAAIRRISSLVGV